MTRRVVLLAVCAAATLLAALTALCVAALTPRRADPIQPL